MFRRSYLKRIRQGHRAFDVNPEDVEAAIARDGRWERIAEWRISTETTTQIEPSGSVVAPYRVSVRCDAEFVAHCPTIESALRWAAVYLKLHVELFYAFGWPSRGWRDGA